MTNSKEDIDMTIKTSDLIIGRLFLAVPLFLFMAGCGPSQEEKMAKDRLEQARIVYNQAKSNPNVTGAAQVPLVDAEKELQAAEKVSDYKEMEHLAYMAEKKSQTAIAIGEGKEADRELEQLQKESNDTIIKVKEREMTAKGLELKTMQTEAERAKTEAEIAKAEALKAKAEAGKTRAENEQLVKELSELKGKQTDRGIVLTIGDLLFATGKASLSTQANVSIDRLAQFLVNHPSRNLSIEGHTDSVGSDEYNNVLSQRRAEAVKSALVGKGVGAERIVTKGLGKMFPIASNSSAQGRQLNRRVEVVVLNEGVKP